MRIHLHRWMWALVLCTLSALAVPASEPKVQSDRDLGFFTATRAETLGLVKRVGILPVRLPTGFEDYDDVKEPLQRLVTEQMRKAGFEVVGPEPYQESYDRLNRQMGGIYDVDSGELKPQQFRAVIDNATREFVEGQRLDGYVYIRILSSKATFYSDSAMWDGARDMSIGRKRANAFTAFWGSTNSTGSLPAYSVAVQIANTQGKIVFGRSGGLQLAAYFDPQKAKGENNFLFVPREQLFREPARLERAVRIATLPLRYSAQEIAAGEKDKAFNPELINGADLPPAPDGVEEAARSPFTVERAQILEKVHRVAISSLDVGTFSPSEETRARYIELIRAELAPLGWTLVSAPTAHKQLNAELKRAGGLFDPFTGKLMEERISTLRKASYQTLGITPQPDAILWVSLKRTFAHHRWGDAEWDGVSQSAITLGPVTKRLVLGGTSNPRAGEGNLEAVSLFVHLRDLNDVALYRSRGGIQLMQQVRDKEAFTLAPSELFKDPAREQPAVHAALRDLVLTPEQLNAELHPQPKRK